MTNNRGEAVRLSQSDWMRLIGTIITAMVTTMLCIGGAYYRLGLDIAVLQSQVTERDEAIARLEMKIDRLEQQLVTLLSDSRTRE